MESVFWRIRFALTAALGSFSLLLCSVPSALAQQPVQWPASLPPFPEIPESGLPYETDVAPLRDIYNSLAIGAWQPSRVLMLSRTSSGHNVDVRRFWSQVQNPEANVEVRAVGTSHHTWASDGRDTGYVDIFRTAELTAILRNGDYAPVTGVSYSQRSSSIDIGAINIDVIGLSPIVSRELGLGARIVFSQDLRSVSLVDVYRRDSRNFSIVPGRGFVARDASNFYVFTPFDRSYRTIGQLRARARSFAYEGETRIETAGWTAMGPPGLYLHQGGFLAGSLPTIDEVQPAPGTLARYATQSAQCAYRPAIPANFLYWGPLCSETADRIDAWSVDGRYRFRFARGQRILLEQFDAAHVRVGQYLATTFNMDAEPTPRGPAEMWNGDTLIFRGAFVGLRPNGSGVCGVPEAPGQTEPCTFASGQRTDAVALARAEQMRLDAVYARREAERIEARRIAAAAQAEEVRRQAEQARLEAARDQAAQQRSAAALWAATARSVSQSMGASQMSMVLQGRNAPAPYAPSAAPSRSAPTAVAPSHYYEYYSTLPEFNCSGEGADWGCVSAEPQSGGTTTSAVQQ